MARSQPRSRVSGRANSHTRCWSTAPPATRATGCHRGAPAGSEEGVQVSVTVYQDLARRGDDVVAPARLRPASQSIPRTARKAARQTGRAGSKTAEPATATVGPSRGSFAHGGFVHAAVCLHRQLRVAAAELVPSEAQVNGTLTPACPMSGPATSPGQSGRTSPLRDLVFDPDAARGARPGGGPARRWAPSTENADGDLSPSSATQN
jgi:hypothetical protein